MSYKNEIAKCIEMVKGIPEDELVFDFDLESVSAYRNEVIFGKEIFSTDVGEVINYLFPKARLVSCGEPL